jgi:asparagine synthase (glutamine-hydrolysing)
LEDSVQHHFVSDVPVGVFLSGGIDSTAVLALAKATGHEGVGAFCIAVDDEGADESSMAKRSAQHFGAAYHEMRLDAPMAQGLFRDFLEHLDQPSIDGLNTFTVSALAREHGMKVVLSGLGGDELFGGYASFQRIPQMLKMHRLARFVPGIETLGSLLLRRRQQHRRWSEFLRSPGSVEDAYHGLRGIFTRDEAGALARWICGEACGETECRKLTAGANVLDQISELEIGRYMRNQLLRDSDVMSMARGLELRVPFVDRALFDSVAGIPARVRLQKGKRLLVDAVPELPEWVTNQKKRGFLFPYQKWLASGWRDAFDDACLDAPVPITQWYQMWSVFVLRHCLQSLQLQSS